MGYLLICCRALIGMVFLLSTAGKIRSRRNFSDFVTTAHELAPRLPARIVAPGVIAFETASVTLLIFDDTIVFGFLVSLGLLTAFTAVIGAAVAKGSEVACRCFGASAVPVGPAHLLRNAVLLVGAAAGLTAALSGPGTSIELKAAITALVAGAAIACMTLYTDDISQLFRPIE